MAKKQNALIFHDLIEMLKKIKDDSEVPPELADELINAGVAISMQTVMQQRKSVSELEALEITRMIILKHFDIILLDMAQDDSLEEFE